MDNDTTGTERIAVLIDADNTSAKYAEEILQELAKYGTPTVKRAYGDFRSPHLSGWNKALNANAIRPMQQHAYTVGKNSSDSALIIDAMDLLYAGNVEAFAIVSSDSDFTSLATRLRESGKTVYGLGRRKTPASLQAAVNKFVYLEVLAEADDEEEKSAEPSEGTANGEASDEAPAKRVNLQSALTKAINATSRDDGWSTLSAVGQTINRTHAAFDPRDFGHQKLSTLVAAQGYLETETTEGRMLVRLKQKRKAPAKKAAKAPAKKTTAQKSAATSARTR